MRTYTGGCHCGAVRFEVTAPAIFEVADCNCSICRMSGYLHWIVPAEHFKLTCGRDALTTYTFNTRTAQHFFCSVCGVKSFYTPRSHPHGVSVNARCIEGIAIESLAVKLFDGADWEKGRAEWQDTAQI